MFGLLGCLDFVSGQHRHVVYMTKTHQKVNALFDGWPCLMWNLTDSQIWCWTFTSLISKFKFWILFDFWCAWFDLWAVSACSDIYVTTHQRVFALMDGWILQKVRYSVEIWQVLNFKLLFWILNDFRVFEISLSATSGHLYIWPKLTKNIFALMDC